MTLWKILVSEPFRFSPEKAAGLLKCGDVWVDEKQTKDGTMVLRDKTAHTIRIGEKRLVSMIV